MIQDMTTPRERYFKRCKAMDNLTLSKLMNDEIRRAEEQGYELAGTYHDYSDRPISAILKFELATTEPTNE